jgi:drug/metabolite transporter (DMT)-like permease
VRENVRQPTVIQLPGSELRGLITALLVACSFATNSALARMAYEGGSNAVTLLTVRTATALVVLAVLLRASRVPLRLPRHRAIKALALGVVMAAYSYGLLGSIQYVPLAVALVTFYTYPLLTALVSAALGRERLEPLTLVALLVALYGLTLVLDIGGEPANPVGIAHALGASVCFTALLLLSDRVRGSGDSRPVTLHILITGVAAYALACSVTGAFVLPHTTLGWIGLVGCPLFFSFAFISLFEAVRMAGPVRAALVLNVEPVASALLGYLLLEQMLTGWQMAGMALVVGAVVAVRLPAAIGGGLAGADRPTMMLLGAGTLLLLAALAVYR